MPLIIYDLLLLLLWNVKLNNYYIFIQFNQWNKSNKCRNLLIEKPGSPSHLYTPSWVFYVLILFSKNILVSMFIIVTLYN